MKILVITGGIGSGKSEVCRILAANGLIAQYNADARVKSLYSSHPVLLGQIEDRLGCVLRDGSGIFVPGKLAARIFSDAGALAAVEELVFPALLEDFDRFVTEHQDADIIVFESATILEKDFFRDFGDEVILVDAPVEIRLERACLRDGAAREDVMARMANQKLPDSMSSEQRGDRVSAVIVNDSDLAGLEVKTDEVMKVLFGDWKRNNNKL